MNEIECIVASVPNKSNVVFEISVGTEQIAQITKEPGEGLFSIEFFPRHNQIVVSAGLDDFISALNLGKRELGGTSVR